VNPAAIPTAIFAGKNFNKGFVDILKKGGIILSNIN
jgi:hypothetical protein